MYDVLGNVVPSVDDPTRKTNYIMTRQTTCFMEQNQK